MPFVSLWKHSLPFDSGANASHPPRLPSISFANGTAGSFHPPTPPRGVISNACMESLALDLGVPRIIASFDLLLGVVIPRSHRMLLSPPFPLPTPNESQTPPRLRGVNTNASHAVPRPRDDPAANSPAASNSIQLARVGENTSVGVNTPPGPERRGAPIVRCRPIVETGSSVAAGISNEVAATSSGALGGGGSLTTSAGIASSNQNALAAAPRRLGGVAVPRSAAATATAVDRGVIIMSSDAREMSSG
mmetsp:Transcript_14114/g.37739  ORF Transcript_14114/g.37739 Transcript_14114/m.37739 type:complete len:248 (+) Transcript_14114:1046-1789(+)